MDVAVSRERALVGLTVLFGTAALACAFVPAWHVVGGWTGLYGLGIGAAAQFFATSTGQRFVIVPAWGMAFVGLVLGVANGGLW